MKKNSQPGGAGGKNELRDALTVNSKTVVMTVLFSSIINLLMLTGPVFMMQVYDRVLTSRSVPTLLALFAIIIVLYAVYGMLESVRTRLFARMALKLDERLGDRLFNIAIRSSSQGHAGGTRSLKELNAIRLFLAGNAPMAYLDAPWSPLFIGILFLFHWILGVFSLVAVLVLAALAVYSQLRTKKLIAEQTELNMKSAELAEIGAQNSEVLIAMGMGEDYRRRWQEANSKALVAEISAGDRLSNMTALTKSLRLLLQSAMLGLGAWLAIGGDITPGTIIAGSILMGRALAPIEQVIGGWRTLVRAKQAYHYLSRLLSEQPPEPERLELPTPQGHLHVENLALAPPGAKKVALSGANFAVEPGKVLGILGASASGKSCLARALVGLWKPISGEIRIDGVRPEHWQRGALGRHIGYLPQGVELFAGSVKDNICRFQPDADDASVLQAAKLANVHEMITALPEGYETELGAFGAHISAGQRQRIGLARALYGDPALIVLDEPNSNLDAAGEAALGEAINKLRANGQTVVIVAHRRGILSLTDYLLVLDAGKQLNFGTKEDVVRAMQQAKANVEAQSSETKPNGVLQRAS